MSKKKTENTILCKKYPFIRDDIFLHAWVDTITNKQKMILEMVNPKSGKQMLVDSIKVKNTIITNIPAEKFIEVASDKNFKEECSEMRSDEKLEELDLEPVEKFKALKYWVKGIAEAGLDALSISPEAIAAANKVYRISTKLMKFLFKIDIEFLYELISIIKRESMKLGVKRNDFLLVNLKPILSIFMMSHSEYSKLKLEERRNWKKDKELATYYFHQFEQIMEVILDLNPPLELFTTNDRYIGFLKTKVAAEYRKIPYIFNLTGVPSNQAIKEIAIDITQNLYEIRKYVISEYKKPSFAKFQFIYKKMIFGRDLFFSELGNLPKGDSIEILKVQSENCFDNLRSKLSNYAMEYQFRLTGVPPEHAMKKIMIGLNETLEEVRSKIILTYKINPIQTCNFIYRGNVLREKKYFFEFGINPRKEPITVMVSCAGGLESSFSDSLSIENTIKTSIDQEKTPIKNENEIKALNRHVAIKRREIPYQFRLTGVPPDVAIKKIRIDIDKHLNLIKKDIQREYKLCPGIQIQLIYKGQVLGRDFSFVEMGVIPKNDSITVIVAQSAGSRNRIKSENNVKIQYNAKIQYITKKRGEDSK